MGQKEIYTSLRASFTYLPALRIGNKDPLFQKEIFDIKRQTGIFERRYALPFQCTSDLAVGAIQPFLTKYPNLRNQIGLLILATTSPNCPSPATAHFVHRDLNLWEDTHCMDVASSCSSFISALRAAGGALQMGRLTLVVAAELKHKGLDPKDLRTLALFADGASGICLQSDPKTSKFRFVFQKSCSSLVENISIPVGGTKEPVTEKNLDRNKLCIQEPKKMFIQTVKFISDAIEECLKNLTCGSHLRFIFVHQANRNILEHVKKKFSNSIDKRIVILMGDLGNMVCASIPVLRSRVLFLMSLFHKFSFVGKKEDLLRAIEHSLEPLCVVQNNSLLFYTIWKNEEIFITDAGCCNLEDCWIARLCPYEFESLRILYTTLQNEVPSDSMQADIWVAAGGGFQTIGIIHEL